MHDGLRFGVGKEPAVPRKIIFNIRAPVRWNSYLAMLDELRVDRLFGLKVKVYQ